MLKSLRTRINEANHQGLITSEETDDYIIPEGWWEYKHYNCDDEYNNLIDDRVIAWREIEPFEKRKLE